MLFFAAIGNHLFAGGIWLRRGDGREQAGQGGIGNLSKTIKKDDETGGFVVTLW